MAYLRIRTRKPPRRTQGGQRVELSLDPDAARTMQDETLPQEVFKSAKFRSMRVTQDICKMAAEGSLPVLS